MYILNPLLSLITKSGRFLSNWIKEVTYLLIDLPGYKENHPTWSQVAISFRSLWGENTKLKHDDPAILIEGFMSSSGPNYLYRICLHANAIKDHLGGARIEVVFDNFRHKFRRESWLLKLAGCTRFYYLRQNPYNIILFTASVAETIKAWKGLHKVEDILDLTVDQICFGDLLYDEILKQSSDSKTITRLNLNCAFAVLKAIFLIKKYRHFIEKNNFKYYVTTHPCYLQYGIMCRVAMNSGAKLILTTDIEALMIDKKIDENSGWSPVYHEYVSDYIRRQLSGHSINEESVQNAKIYLKDRFDGNIDQVDVKLAFENKKQMSRNELTGTTSQTQKIGFIMAHIMSDASHCSHNMLYRDYLIWLRDSIKICAKNTRIHWFVKPHPAAQVYSEEGLVELEVEMLGAKNVSICPPDMSTASVANAADVVLTMQGTAGLEFSCAGIPVILAGAPFYSGFGFTKDCRSLEEYKNILLEAHMIARLSEEEINTAYKVLASYKSFVITNNLVFDSNLLAKIWGYKDSDQDEVLDTFSKRVIDLDVKQEPQYKRILQELSLKQEA